MDFTLVLGGGGPVGTAWYAGLAAGLADEGLDLRGAETIIGTSAGASAGAWLATGIPLEALVIQAHGWIDHDVRLDLIDAEALQHVLAILHQREEVTPDDLRRIGGLARNATAHPASDYIAGHRRRLPTGSWPAALRAAVVDIDTGELVLLGPEDGVDLATAVAASSSPAGIKEPVHVAGRAFMDAGMRSGTNADAAASFPTEAVLIVAAADDSLPLVGPLMRAALDREVAVLRDSGKQVHVISPDERDRDRAAMTINLLDVQRVPAAIEAGRTRGREPAPTLRSALAASGAAPAS